MVARRHPRSFDVAERVQCGYRLGYSSQATDKLGEIAQKVVRNRGIHEWETRNGEPRGSTWYVGAAGTLAEAVVAGYYGVELDGSTCVVRPKLGEAAGRIALREPPTGRRFAYAYGYDASDHRITLRGYADRPSRCEIAVLLPPWVRDVSALTVDGRDVPVRIRQLGHDRYAEPIQPVRFDGARIEFRLR